MKHPRSCSLAAYQSHAACRRFTRQSDPERCGTGTPAGAPSDTNLLLVLATKAKLCGGEQPIDHKIVLPGTIVDKFSATLRSQDEPRRHLALADATRESDDDRCADRY